MNLQASTDLPKKIFLTWNKSKYKDFERYYLYRSEEKEGEYELIAKLYNNRFSDNVGVDGAKYFYKVSQVDTDGLESKNDDYIIMGATLPKPASPKMNEAKFDGKKVVIRWFKVDPRTKSYIVKRQAKTGWFDTKTNQFTTNKEELVDTHLLSIQNISTPFMQLIVRYSISNPRPKEGRLVGRIRGRFQQRWLDGSTTNKVQSPYNKRLVKKRKGTGETIFPRRLAEGDSSMAIYVFQEFLTVELFPRGKITV